MTTISGDCGDDTLSGTNKADVISGGGGDDVIEGGNGSDVISGGSGSDVIDGGNGNDVISGGSGSDVIDGGNGNDVISGGSGSDIIDGGSGKDVLLGGSGNDILFGGEGADWLQGGSGYDVFAYLSESESNSGGWDRIIDFAQGRDKIDLSELLGLTTDLAWGNKTATVNGAWYLNSGSSTFVLADTTGNGIADFKIELKYTCGLNLTANDFLGVGMAPVANNGAAQADEDTVVTGTLVATDPDGGTLNYSVVSGPAHGALVLNADGTFSYTPQANFNGSDGFTYKANDGSSDSNVATVVLTVNSVNDAAVLSSATTALDESNAPLITGGTLTISDVDSAETFVEQTGTVGDHGTFTIDTAGVWSYTADSAFDNLNVGDSVSDTFTVKSFDGTQTSVQVTINGTNDAALITGTATGAVVEAGGVANVIPGMPTATGDLLAADVDNATDSLQAVAAGAVSANGYGTYGVTADGVWAYTLDNTDLAVQALNNGNLLSDTFTVHSEDGTAQMVTITIHGADDLLFDENANTVDFNAVVAGTYVAGTQYDALSGNDIVTLPNNVAQAMAAGFDSTQTFHGGAGNDNITAVGNLDSSIDGGTGNDTISGGAGNDTLNGGAGNDTLDGGAGTDTASYASAGGGVIVDLSAGTTFDDGDGGTDTLNSIENVTGSAFIDTLIGDAGANMLDGGAGNDQLSSFGANSTLIGGEGNDSLASNGDNSTLYGGPGDDQLFNSSANSTLMGGEGDDLLFSFGDNSTLDGGLGNDTLIGGDGNDTLIGGPGDDTLAGGLGADVFKYSFNPSPAVTSGDGFDTVVDFAWGMDKLEFNGLGGTSLDQFMSLFNVTEIDVFSDGVVDTVVALSDDSWGVTLLGVSGHTEADFYSSSIFS